MALISPCKRMYFGLKNRSSPTGEAAYLIPKNEYNPFLVFLDVFITMEIEILCFIP